MNKKIEYETLKYYNHDVHIVALKECPLCGTFPKFVQDDMLWFIECPECGLTLGQPNGYVSRLEMCNDWNRRYKKSIYTKINKFIKNYLKKKFHKMIYRILYWIF